MEHTVLIVEDDQNLREALCETLESAGYHAHATGDGEAALRYLRQHGAALVISDLQMRPMDGTTLLAQLRQQQPRLPVVLMTAYGTIAQAVAAMQAGASDFLVKPFEADTLLQLTRRHLPDSAGPARHGMIAADPRSLAVLEQLPLLAASDATVLITGESGTGKEVLARSLHALSPRSRGPFVAVNCAAIPEQMLEATLFGHEKGAFTGALAAHAGKFEQAQGGTLLLDEISEMPLALQAKLLRVLQEREVERVGARQPIALDVRVLATSNRRLREEVRNGRFREDLYFRLNVLPLAVAPLRERRADILPLAAALLARHARDVPPPQLTPAAAQRLQEHDWPGNVRELENVIQRALVLCRAPQIESWQLQLDEPDAGIGSAAIAPVGAAGDALNSARFRHEAELIARALRCGSRRSAAAQLGISERTLRYKLARMRAEGIAPVAPGTACA